MAVTKDGKIAKPSKDRDTKPRRSPEQIQKVFDDIKTEDADDRKPKRPIEDSYKTNVTIDGKTYTCAACKAGHRVGVCKHAGERPMRPTHPPGRPHAGNPKKHVCDCPKSCQCSKRNCRCPRNCACTQTMFMLVFIPGQEDAAESPGQRSDEGKEGEWKIKEQVVTDLKGNVLSQAEIEERNRRKEAQKPLGQISSSLPMPGASIIAHQGFTDPSPLKSNTASPALEPIVNSPSQAKPKASGGCCSHKQKVQAERQAVQKLDPATVANTIGRSASRHGCNCGASCTCAFCPQHPNNQTSIDLARQQAMNFVNQPAYLNQPIMPFTPGISQDMSCMGGPPRFAISRYASQPSLADFGSAFAAPHNGGFMLAYPLTQRPSFTAHDSPIIHNEIAPASNNPFSPLPDAVPAMPSLDFTDDTLQYLPSDFDIGDAIVASGGPDGWTNDPMTSDLWPTFAEQPLPVLNDDLANHVSIPPTPFTSIDTHLAPSTTPITVPPNTFELDVTQYFDYSGLDLPQQQSISSPPTAQHNGI